MKLRVGKKGHVTRDRRARGRAFSARRETVYLSVDVRAVVGGGGGRENIFIINSGRPAGMYMCVRARARAHWMSRGCGRRANKSLRSLILRLLRALNRQRRSVGSIPELIETSGRRHV